ncbi:MAG: hypothetical protein KDD56_05070 [Bdellovibrionales bacterium]|nr:hypothetical protein [Bdellovibrionales bacterium]
MYKKSFFKFLLVLAFILPGSALAGGVENLASVDVAPSIAIAGLDQSFEVTLVVEGGEYNEPLLMFYQILEVIAPGGSASYINLEDVEVTIPAELNGIVDQMTPSIDRVPFSLNAPIPEGNYTFVFKNAHPNSSAGGYAGYQFLVGFSPSQGDSSSYVASNFYFSVNADLGEGNKFDAPEVTLNKKKTSATVDWSNSAYAESANRFDLEVAKKSGKIVKTYSDLSSDDLSKAIKKKVFKKGNTKKFKVRVKAYFDDLETESEWSEYVEFKIKKKK